MQKNKFIVGVSILVLLSVGAVFAYNSLRDNLPHEDTRDESPTIAEYRKITADEAKKMLDETDSLILLDARTDEEYREQHIPGAVLIPDYEISARAEAELPDKDALILIYCRSGRRSANATNELVGMGYTNVYDFGGIIDWPYETK